ncbi:hypothetical protein C8Q76DRAFT_68296 [Earliella scabrosa]|nr:hypothetical protein C8Q76DRAFT_68296 [Earliella scabrosa]
MGSYSLCLFHTSIRGFALTSPCSLPPVPAPEGRSQTARTNARLPFYSRQQSFGLRLLLPSPEVTLAHSRPSASTRQAPHHPRRHGHDAHRLHSSASSPRAQDECNVDVQAMGLTRARSLRLRSASSTWLPPHTH